MTTTTPTPSESSGFDNETTLFSSKGGGGMVSDAVVRGILSGDLVSLSRRVGSFGTDEENDCSCDLGGFDCFEEDALRLYSFFDSKDGSSRYFGNEKIA